MGTAVDRLVDIASPALVGDDPELRDAPELEALLSKRNGFYAFQSALHVFPSRSTEREIGVEEWNDGALWRSAYPDIEREVYFFAEDAFGGQFALHHNGVHGFDPETGSFESIAPTIEEWAAIVLDDYQLLTGYPLASAWQQLHGPLASGKRLVPKIPFIFGGAFAVENLYAATTAESLRYRGDLAQQLRSVPDGTTVRLRVIE